MKKHIRPTWDQYFMEIAHVAKSRSTCIRMRVGAVLVRNKHLLATGYNETPSGTKNCVDGGCERCTKRHKGIYKANEHKDRCLCVHAEQNVILQSAYHGVSTKGSSLYSTIMPCNYCAKLLINAGIIEVVIDQHHTDKFGLTLFKRAGVIVRRLK
ncbi:MAG TPA: dCMP deaminase family protein [Patescibacteria group bacterium]|nr:dCMP deaminase family protein [Patescibacteria group bacterium]